MKPRSKIRLMVGVGFVVVALSGAANLAAFGQYDYRVNTSSFTAPGYATLGGDPSQALQYAAQHWAAYAGAPLFFRQLGSTNKQPDDACQFLGENFVFGFPGIIDGETDCNTLALVPGCWGGSWAVFVSGCGNLTLGEPSLVPLRRDFHLTLTHEFGHIILESGLGVDGAGHLSQTANEDDDTLMARQARAFAFSGFGVRDIQAIGGSGGGVEAWGDGYLSNQLWTSTSSGSQAPSGFAGLVATSRWSGLGGFDFQRAASQDLIAIAAANIEPHRVYVSTQSGSESPVSLLQSEVNARPTFVLDTRRNQRWMIVRDSSNNNYAHLYKMTSSGQPLVWAPQGAIPDIVSRYPVGAAYDWFTDRIVVVWMNSRGDTPIAPGWMQADCTQANPFVNGILSPLRPQPFGCQGEYLATFLDPTTGARISTSRFITPLGPGALGYSGLGAPSVVCQGDSSSSICQAFVVSRDAARQMKSWAFLPSPQGVYYYFAPVPEAGTTDFPISTSSLPATGSGVAVQTVLGSGDRAVYFRSRSSPWTSWSGWQNAHPGVQATTGPNVRFDPAATNYKLVFGRP